VIQRRSVQQLKIGSHNSEKSKHCNYKVINLNTVYIKFFSKIMTIIFSKVINL